MKKLLYTLLAVSIIFSACKKEEEEPTNNTNNNSNNTDLSIGDYHQGGVIFYLSANGGGLICDVSDVANSLNLVIWGCAGDSIGVQNSTIGTGFSNTMKIINECNDVGIAAEICYNLTKLGYSDWYLPSEEELIEIYLNRVIINATSISNGGYALTMIDSDDGSEDTYWSSTEAPIPEEYAVGVRFSDGHSKGFGKSRNFNVRAVRAF
jgi:hypothetical protein